MQIPAIPALCCHQPCSDNLTVVLYEGSGYQEIYEGNGDPNGVLTPENPTKPAEYHNLDTPGETWWWIVANQAWS